MRVLRHDKRICIRMSSQNVDRLEAIACIQSEQQKRSISYAEIVRVLVEQYLEVNGGVLETSDQ